MNKEIQEVRKLTNYWLIKHLFLCILQTFPFFQPSDPILLCLTHMPLPPSLFSVLSDLSFVMEMTRPESK